MEKEVEKPKGESAYRLCAGCCWGKERDGNTRRPPESERGQSLELHVLEPLHDWPLKNRKIGQ